MRCRIGFRTLAATALILASLHSASAQNSSPQPNSPRQKPADVEQPADARPPVDFEQLSRRIAELDADEFATRKQATEALIRLGEPALEQLRSALAKAKSAETRQRLQKVIEQIELFGGEPHDLKLTDLLDLTHKIVAAKGASEADKAQLEAELKRWLRLFGEASGDPKLALPIDFDGVNDAPPVALLRYNLVIAKEVDHVHSATDSIILSDGSVQVFGAYDSLIIARLGVTINSCRNCVVVTGASLKTRESKKCVLVSRGHVETDTAYASVLAAGESLRSGGVASVTFVNTPQAEVRTERNSRYVRIPHLIVGQPDRENPLKGALTLTHIGSDLVLFRLADGTGEYVARKDQPINRPDGRPIESLKGWRLQYVADSRIATFKKGEQICVLRLEPSR